MKKKIQPEWLIFILSLIFNIVLVVYIYFSNAKSLFLEDCV